MSFCGGSEIIRGLSGGVSIADPEMSGALARSSAVRCDWASCSDAGTDELRGLAKLMLRSALVRASVEVEVGVELGIACECEWVVAVRGRPFPPSIVNGATWSKQDWQGTGSPSVTMRGVGPWRSQ